MPRLKVLMVTPVEQGAGETITALHVAENLVARGHEIRFLATPFAKRFLDPCFSGRIAEFAGDTQHDVDLWNAMLDEFQPDAIVFADYPMLSFSFGVAPLAKDPEWVKRLDTLDATLVTLDHFGFAQREMAIFLGPAHLTTFQFQHFPAIPEHMHIMIPCPMHEPRHVPGRRGVPFRYWDLPLEIRDEERQTVRNRYLARSDELLVFHSVPNWAWQAAKDLGLSFYRFLPQIWEAYFGRLSLPVTIISVNNGQLFDPPPGGNVRIVNLAALPTAGFEKLIFGADLLITENRVSISMGRAICGFQTCAALTNSRRLLSALDRASPPVGAAMLAMENARPGTVYPFEVFPSGMVHDLEQLILYQDNSITQAFATLEVFGGDTTAEAIDRLLTDPVTRAELRERAERYVEGLGQLCDGAQVLEQLVAAGGRRRRR